MMVLFTDTYIYIAGPWWVYCIIIIIYVAGSVFSGHTFLPIFLFCLHANFTIQEENITESMCKKVARVLEDESTTEDRVGCRLSLAESKAFFYSTF